MTLLQRFTHAGRPHEGGPACEAVHCWACGRDGPRRFKVMCGECFHAWRWRLLLSLADARLWWRLDRPQMEVEDDEGGSWKSVPAPWWRLDLQYRRLHIRRPSKIYSCPCCSHDL